MSNSNRGAVRRSLDEIGKQDASRTFRQARDEYRRMRRDHYNDSPVWGYVTPSPKRRGRKS